jgi:hypothetical protein
MAQSKFQEFIDKGFQSTVLRVQNTINGLPENEKYYHQQYLDLKFSLDGKWTSLSADNKNFVADIVAMDSSLPLKSRGSLGRASGEIFKLGQRLQLREQELTELDTLIATGQMNEAVRRFFEDTPKVIKAIHERNEALFLTLASTGVALVADDESNGVDGVRLDAKIPSKNFFGSKLPWSNALATPLTDLRQMLDEAEKDGKTIIRFLMNQSDFNKLKNSSEGKDLHASFIGNFGNTKLIPSKEAFITAFMDELGAEIQIIKKSVTYLKNKTETIVKPWKDGAITGITQPKIGSLVWSPLAEMNHPIENVSYQRTNDFILVSKFRDNQPTLLEVTTSQARVCPVLNNVEGIYLLDSTLTRP